MDERQRTIIVLILFLFAMLALLIGEIRNLSTCESLWC
jgi:hypothetical protein